MVGPVLRTYPSLKIWVAGCSTGEEVYSLANLLREEGLLDRSLIYATDINPNVLQKATAGVYEVDRIAAFTEAHRKSGARTSLSDYYTAAYGRAVFDKSLREHIVFSDHSLATDSVFAEVQFVSCRNVLIYFNRDLQDRAIGLFRDALCRKGFLGIGSKESLRFSSHAGSFAEVAPRERPSLLVEIFEKRCAVPIREADDKEPAKPGMVYFAPPDYHMLLEKDRQIALSADEPVHYCRPSI